MIGWAFRLIARLTAKLLRLAVLIWFSPVVAALGWGWLLYRLGGGLRFLLALRGLARDELTCPSGHAVTVFGKWRCPACRAIWQGPGHRCHACLRPMNYLVCQEPGCGLAANLPELPS